MSQREPRGQGPREAGASDTLRSSAFVGREAPLSLLTGAIARARAGEGALVVVVGEAGMGKTTLARQAVQLARQANFVVLWGSAWQSGGAPALWPWTQIVRGFLRSQGQLPDELRDLASTARESQTLDTAPARFGFYDRVSRWLREVSTRSPLVIVLEDLHWADSATLELLTFVAHELHAMPLVLLCSVRSPTSALGPELARLARVIQLEGLSLEEVRALVSNEPGNGEDWAETLVQQTGGNPLFVCELVQLSRERRATGSEAQPEVRSVMARRLAQRSEPCRELLGASAVLGEEFSLPLVAAVLARPIEQLRPQLEEAAASGWIASCSEPQTARFCHALLREVAYDAIEPARRAGWHRRAGSELELRALQGLQPWAGEIALHFERAGTPADLERALRGLEAAAHRLRPSAAHGEVSAHLQHALRLLDQVDAGSHHRRCELLLELTAADRARGAFAQAQQAAQRTAAIARAHASPELLARAALAFAGEFTAGAVDARETALLGEALAALPAGDSALRARVLARLARALLFGPEHARREELIAAASAMARRIADPATLAHVLYDQRQASWSGAQPQAFAATREVLRLAEQLGDGQLALHARALELGDLLEANDLARYRLEAAAYARSIAEQNQTAHAWQPPLHAATLELFAGRFAAAAKLTEQSRALGRRVQQRGIEQFCGSVTSAARLLQGRHVAPTAASEPAADFTTLAWRVPALCGVGLRDQARRELEQVSQRDFEDVPRDAFWTANLAQLALATHYLADEHRAQRLYALLAPHAPYNVRVGRIGISILGSTQFYLGLLALTMRDWNAAVRHLEDAVSAHSASGMLPMLAHSQQQLAHALQQAGDAEAASVHERAARQRLTALDMAPLFAPAERAADSGMATEQTHIMFWREADYWIFARAASKLQLRDAVGLRMLAQLLSEPGREFAALALKGQAADQVHDRGDAGEVLDARAIAAYRQRLKSLAIALAEAERAGLVQESQRLSAEAEAIREQLSAAIGLGGRVRRSASALERARVSVTKALRASIARIAQQDAELGAHLELSTQTGHVCCYRSDPASRIRFVPRA